MIINLILAPNYSSLKKLFLVRVLKHTAYVNAEGDTHSQSKFQIVHTTIIFHNCTKAGISVLQIAHCVPVNAEVKLSNFVSIVVLLQVLKVLILPLKYMYTANAHGTQIFQGSQK